MDPIKEALLNTLKLLWNAYPEAAEAQLKSSKDMTDSKETLAFAVSALEMPHFKLTGNGLARQVEKSRLALQQELKQKLIYWEAA